MFFFVLIHLHLVLITANNFHSKNFDTCTSNHITKSTPKSSCPFKATKAFFNRQTAFIYSAFNPTLGKQNTKELSPIKPEAQQAFSFLTSKDVLKFVDLRKHSRKNFQLFSAVDERISESKVSSILPLQNNLYIVAITMSSINIFSFKFYRFHID
jgi:hypothetical protein